MAAGQQPGMEPRVFRIFISYASEDFPIASAIGSCLKIALGDYFAEVNLDKWFLQPGIAFKKQIESKLQKTDVFIIVYTGAEKQSHGYTGWEVGYFDHVMETAQPGRLKISLYLDSPPAISADEQGIPLSLGRDKLDMTCETFASQLAVRPDEPICLLLEDWQEQVGGIIEASGFPKPQKRPEQDPATCVRNLKLAIFRYLKGTVQTVVKPQKQFTIRVKGAALEQANDGLPADAELHPMGAGTMGLFGLQDEPITWEKFSASTADNRFCNSWLEAITSVVMSSFPDRVNVDNSQIIFASDEVKAYRVILTTATKYYDDYREFSVYFVETLNRADYGDQSTSYLLKGLELVCRFRFMYLETDSEFSSQNILASRIERLPELANKLLKELNLSRKDARDAGLDEPKVWRNFVTWENILKMSTEYVPRELKVREIIRRIAAAKCRPSDLPQLREELSGVLEEMENAIRPANTLLLREMARKLENMVQDQDSQPAMETKNVNSGVRAIC